jgi:hypothetical protein
VSLEGGTIVWRPGRAAQQWLNTPTDVVLKRLHARQLPVHLTLKGRFVYEAGKPEVNVDGEAFGLVEGAEFHEVLQSGDGRRGGDLELWFRLRPD